MAAVLGLVAVLTFPACQEDFEEYQDIETPELKSSLCPPDLSVYYGPVVFRRDFGTPVVKKVTVSNDKYACYDDFVLKIKNGRNKWTRVSSAEVWIDGVLVAGPSDFNRNVYIISKPLFSLSPEAVLEVKLKSTPGSYLEIWIEGSLTSTVPVFGQIGPIELNEIPPVLPLVSENGVTGSWDPATISTDTPGTFTFIFTPEEDQCATGIEMTIEVINKGTIEDVEGNIYPTIKIGSQWWMAENLRTLTYNNGDIIGSTQPATLDISGETEPEYQWSYGGEEAAVESYGRLYTWYTISDDRGVCPSGWHVPTDAEWTILTDYLAGSGFGYEGSGTDIAKSMASAENWIPDGTPGSIGNSPETNNSSGFSAVPGGYRISSGVFQNTGIYTGWWSMVEKNSVSAWYRALYNNSSMMLRGSSNKRIGFSVRCIRD